MKYVVNFSMICDHLYMYLDYSGLLQKLSGGRVGKSSKLSQPFVSLYPHRAKPKVPVTLGFQEQNITTLHREKTTKRRQ